MPSGSVREPKIFLNIGETERAADLRRRVREAMARPPVLWDCPARLDGRYMSAPLAVRKARAMEQKLLAMPTDLWEGQLFAGSLTLEEPRLHCEWGFPDYATPAEKEAAAARGLGIHSVFGHIVPDYGKLLARGLAGIRAEAEAQRAKARTPAEEAFLDAACVALDAVSAFAAALAQRCDEEAAACAGPARAAELRRMAENLRQVPAGPALTFWQALQSVWLLHLVFHATMDGNALGRLDQYAWPYLAADLDAGRLDPAAAAELVDCFCLKFNERAQTTEEQRPESRRAETVDPGRRTRHTTSSQVGTDRDGIDAANHWLQNIVISGLTPDGGDGTNPLTFLLLESYRRNRMTNPLLTVRLHEASPEVLVRHVAEVLREGGGMPALFNDGVIVPALVKLGIPPAEARDYTNDGCWEVIIPGRTDFCFQRLSLMLCLERALNRGRANLDGVQAGPDTGDPAAFTTYDEVWRAFLTQMESMIGGVIDRVVAGIDDRSTIAPVPLLSALVEGPLEARRDLTAGGARYRIYALLAESAAHAIDSLAAIREVVFTEHAAGMAELCAALRADFEGYAPLRARLLNAPKYGNDDARADEVGRAVIEAFAGAVARLAAPWRHVCLFPCGVGTFSWYIGIGEGLGASPDGRRAGEPVSSNFSPALGRDMEGIPAAILSHGGMGHDRLPAGAPLDLRLARRLVCGEEGVGRLAGLIRAFLAVGGGMMTLTVADTEELRAAQRDPDRHGSLRVRMGGWSAYFTALSREQQDHHIRRQEGRP
ncbi:MAG: pyruvate formate lyase family protein [Patescibacteria group bacterium]